jgi:hypothetical protein
MQGDGMQGDRKGRPYIYYGDHCPGCFVRHGN